MPSSEKSTFKFPRFFVSEPFANVVALVWHKIGSTMATFFINMSPGGRFFCFEAVIGV